MTKIILKDINVDCTYAYVLINGKEYDMRRSVMKGDNKIKFEITVRCEDYDDNLIFVLVDDRKKIKYKVN